jgi:hypothetical protein
MNHPATMPGGWNPRLGRSHSTHGLSNKWVRSSDWFPGRLPSMELRQLRHFVGQSHQVKEWSPPGRPRTGDERHGAGAFEWPHLCPLRYGRSGVSECARPGARSNTPRGGARSIRVPGPPPTGNLAVPIFSHGSLVVELYTPVGHDPQKLHTRDEVYFVTRAKGRLFDGAQHHPL